MKVIHCSEYFGGRDEPVAFQHMRVIFQREGEFYQGLSKKRYRSDADVKENDLYDTILIPTENLNPDYQSEFTESCHPEAVQLYTKRQRLSHYDPREPGRLKHQTLEEVKICEYLRKHSHRNIAVYHGCEVKDRRIIGLCFTRYSQTLMEMVNPMKYNKRKFALQIGGSLSPEMGRWLDDIKSGIRHLHSLGLIHNYINPSNIMFDGDTLVLIDFGSCRPKGGDISMVGRTYEWYDDKINVAISENDLNALEEISSWLRGNVPKFKF